MRERAQVVIIGAGLMGISIAYHLAQRGCTDVLLVEQRDNVVRGSTAHSLAGVRHQFSSPVNVRLSLYSIERLKNFAAEVGTSAGLEQTGYLFLLNDAATWETFQRNAAMQRALGARVELLPPAEAARLVPGLNTADLRGATFGPDDGYCDPHSIAAGYLQRAREHGVQVQCNTNVTGFLTDDDEYVTAVETSNGVVQCETVVNAAGAWAGEVAAQVGLHLPVRPYRRNIYVATPFPQLPGPSPLTIDVDTNVFLRKTGDTLYLGRSNPEEPSSFDTTVDWEWLQTIMRVGQPRFPMLRDFAPVRAQCWAGLYEITPDANPVLGRHPEVPNYIDASGFSGHGVMHAPAVGLLMAEEILDGRARTIAIDDLRITRFSNTHLRTERNAI